MADIFERAKAALEGATKGPWKVCQTTIHGRKYGGCWVEGPDEPDDEAECAAR
jgi:hypothetical protein